jgi:hypothetical protein
LTLAKQSLTYLLSLRSTNFGLAATITNDVVAFGVKNDEGICWKW